MVTTQKLLVCVFGRIKILRQKGADMSITTKRIIILAVIIIIGFALGRLAIRAVMNMMLGGTLFGGNLL